MEENGKSKKLEVPWEQAKTMDAGAFEHLESMMAKVMESFQSSILGYLENAYKELENSDFGKQCEMPRAIDVLVHGIKADFDPSEGFFENFKNLEKTDG